jgi:hypothetical protein
MPRHASGCPSFARSAVSRRQMLRAGAVGALGLGLPGLLAADESRQETGIIPRADRCIIIFLNGGPSHLDMWDMKPEGPSESRGEFKPISSSLPGVQMSEHLPKLSQQMHLASLVRSMHHTVNNSHAAAVYVSMTGHDRGEFGGGFLPTDNPTPGAVLTRLRPTPADVVPHACLPYKTKEGAKGPPQPGFWGGWLGRNFDPLWILKDPNADDFSVPEFTLKKGIDSDRMVSRSSLLNQLNTNLANGPGRSPLDAMSRFQQQALDILVSPTVQSAFRIEQEKDAVRDTYGRNIYGQSVLLARRLLEAGTRLVTVSWAPDANATWDTHGANFSKLKTSLLPQFDAAAAALIEDLVDRGMLDRTLVAILGDFGRTPKINANAGRDHWNFCYSIMLAGGGIRPGWVHGASDKSGAYPADNPTAPADILATIYRLLGVDHQMELYDRFRRPHQIVSRGNVVPGLLA